MDTQAIVFGAIALLLGAAFLGPMQSPSSLPSELIVAENSSADAEELRRIAKEAEDKVAQHSREVQQSLRQIERASALREANYQRRLKEIDYENKKLRWDNAAAGRARDEQRRKQDEQNRIAEITQENQRLGEERERKQRARDEEYRSEQEADSERRQQARRDDSNEGNWGPSRNVSGRYQGHGSSGGLARR